MIKILEDLETTDKKQKMLDCVNTIESSCQILKQVISSFCSEEDIEK